MADINTKKPKVIGEKVPQDDEEETCDDDRCPSTPVKSNPRTQPEKKFKTPKEASTGKSIKQSPVVDDRKDVGKCCVLILCLVLRLNLLLSLHLVRIAHLSLKKAAPR